MQVSKAAVNIMNGHHEICRQFFGTKSWIDLKPAMHEHYDSLMTLPNHKPPVLACVDDIEMSEGIILKCYPTIDKLNGGHGVRLCAIHSMFRIEKGVLSIVYDIVEA